MNELVLTYASRRRGGAMRWSGSALAVLMLHAGLLALMLRTALPTEVPPAPPETVLLELPPILETTPEPQLPIPPVPEPMSTPPASPPDTTSDPVPVPKPPPTPESARPAIEPVPPGPALPVTADAVILPVPRNAAPTARASQSTSATRPIPRPRPAPPPFRAAAPPRSAQPNTTPVLTPVPLAAAPAAAPVPVVNSNAVPTWRSDLIARLQRFKRYPDTARSRGDQGVAVVTFTMDRSGRVLSATLARSSGIPALDDEAIALLHRAEPLPAMPSEIAAQSITLTVPVNFALR